MVNLGTCSAYFTLRISNYEIYMQECPSLPNVQNWKSIYPAGSNDWAVMWLDGNKETQQEFETEYVLTRMYVLYTRKLTAYHAWCEMIHDCRGVGPTKSIIYW
jgi:hypothetical protein